MKVDSGAFHAEASEAPTDSGYRACTDVNSLCYNSPQSMDRCSVSRTPAAFFGQFGLLSIYFYLTLKSGSIRWNEWK